MRDRFIDSQGICLFVVDRGPKDGVPVLLLHGWPDSSELWTDQIAALAHAGYRVLAPDQRGFGRSDAPDGVEAYGLSTLIGDVRNLLAAASVDRAHFVGHDWGAGVAWTIARYLPDLLLSLTALSVGHPNAFRASGLRQRQLSWYMLLFLHEELAERWLSDDDFAGLRRFVGENSMTERWVTDLSRPGRLTASLNWYRANMPAATFVLPPDDQPPVSVDTMGIWSSGDMALTKEQMTGSEAHVAGHWRFERLDCGHWIPAERPEELNHLLLDWLVSRTP